jgi:hypothetical protein
MRLYPAGNHCSPEVGSLPDFFNGNDVFPVVDYSLSGFVEIVIKQVV